jgi:phage terminase large subunit-like protein
MRRESMEQDPSGRRWYAQIQNDPLADARGFFVGEHPLAGDVPQSARIVFGVDAAFTAGKKSDYFACVGLADMGADVMGVFRVIRHQRGLTAAIETLGALSVEFPGARFCSYTSGQERGVYDHVFQVGGIAVEQMLARWNKGTRAQKAARSWNAGKIQTRLGERWTAPFLRELHGFDGGETGVDDQVDALVSAHDAMQMGRPLPGIGQSFTFGRACM